MCLLLQKNTQQKLLHDKRWMMISRMWRKMINRDFIRWRKNGWMIKLNTCKQRNSYSLLYDVYGPLSYPVNPHFTKGGNSLIDNFNGILKRWHKHFNELLNPSTVDEVFLNSIHNRPTFQLLDERETAIK